MDIYELIEKLENIANESDEEIQIPTVFISVGGYEVSVENVVYMPETEDTISAVVLS